MNKNLTHYTAIGWLFLFSRGPQGVLHCTAIRGYIVHVGSGLDMHEAFCDVERKMFFPGEPPNVRP